MCLSAGVLMGTGDRLVSWSLSSVRAFLCPEAAHKQPPPKRICCGGAAKNRHISTLRSVVLTPLDDRIDQRMCPLKNNMFHYIFLLDVFLPLQLSIIHDFR